MLILSGRVSIKMAPVVRRIYDQMLEPKWVIAMGACSSSAGVFNNYALVQGADKFLPVDVHVPGCPPRPEALLHGIIKLQAKIKGDPTLGWRERYRAEGTEELGDGPRAERSLSSRSARRHRTGADRTRPAGAGAGLGRRHRAPPRHRDADRRPRARCSPVLDLAARDAQPELPLPRERARLRLPARTSRASASTTSCSTWSASSACT